MTDQNFEPFPATLIPADSAELPGGQVLYSKDTEEAALGIVLVFPNDADEYPLEPEDFYIHKHRFVWEAFAAVRAESETPNLVNVIDMLERQGKLGEVGGGAFLTHLMSGFVASSGLGSLVRILKDYRTRRTLVEQANWIHRQAFDLESDLGAVQDKVIMAMSSARTGNRHSRPIRDVVSEVYDEAYEAAQNPNATWGIQTGFIDFDRVTGGLHTAETIYVAGAPGVGKSIFANQLGLQVSEHVPVWLVSLEMKDKRLVRRLLSAEGEIYTRSILTGLMDETEWTKLTHACEVLQTKNIHIWDRRGMTLAEFRAEGVRLKNQYGIQVIVLDYLYLLAGYEGMEMTPRTEILSAGVQALAEQLDVAIVTVNSVVKEGMKGYASNMADLRGSGQLLHDADTVCFITKQAQTLSSVEIDPQMRLRKIEFAKMRDGDMGDGYSIQMGLTRGYPKFVDLTSKDSDVDSNLKAAFGDNGKGYRQGTMERFHE